MTVLNDTPTHGYEIIAIVHKEFGVLLSPGTLYPLIHSLEAQGLIEPILNGGGEKNSLSGKSKRETKVQ